MLIIHKKGFVIFLTNDHKLYGVGNAGSQNVQDNMRNLIGRGIQIEENWPGNNADFADGRCEAMQIVERR